MLLIGRIAPPPLSPDPDTACSGVPDQGVAWSMFVSKPRLVTDDGSA